VYWSQRIWPKENKQPKPPFDSIMSEAQIRAKVEDIVKKSNALDIYWNRPISAEQLQAELERIATHTRRPAIVKQIWASLNNDPYLIAECFARPVLVDRLIWNWYSFDERFHGELKKQIQNELARYSNITQMESSNGDYSVIEWIKDISTKSMTAGRKYDGHAIIIDNENEWNQLINEFNKDIPW